MLVLGMKSKRQRHPNVRLGEVGEIPAAFSCGILLKSKVNWESKRQKLGNKKDGKVYLEPACGFSSQLSEFTSSDSTETQKWEYSSPNSVKEAIQGVSSDEASASKPRLVFGALAPKVRVMKRGRSVRCSSVMGGSWHSGVSPGIGNENGKVYGGDGFEEAISNIHADLCAAELSDPETSNMSKGSYRDSFDDLMPRNNWKEISADEGHCTALEGQMVHASVGDAVVNNVRGWLDDLGFGKYGHIFERHEVDGEVLPLLTFEDLKEMGVNAVRCRRKMFNAIQLLKDGVSA